MGVHYTLRKLFLFNNTLVNTYMKTCSTSLIVREMQMKITKRYHLTPVKMAIIKKRRINKSWQECGEKATFVHCLGCKLVSHYGKYYGGSSEN